MNFTPLASTALIVFCLAAFSAACSRETAEDRLDEYLESADACLEKSEEEFRDAHRILDAYGTEHGQDPNFVGEYLQLESRLKDPIYDAHERCLEDAKEKAGLE